MLARQSASSLLRRVAGGTSIPTSFLCRPSSRTLTGDSFGKSLVDPCEKWTFDELQTPLKPIRTGSDASTAPQETLTDVPDMSIDGLDLASIKTAIANMTTPASIDKPTLGRWGKNKDEDVTLAKKYT